MGYETVIVGSDGSRTAELAVRNAAELAVDHEARLVIVTAYKPARRDPADQAFVPEDVRWAITDVNQAEDRVRHGLKIAADVGLARALTHAAAGSAADVLLDAADQYGADVIVVGSKGLTKSSRAVLGSVAAAVAHHAPCDVLIVQTVD
ncbi:MAG TPA: universal stress protein [Acidimicrobiales bacterium]|nr:universal stress protein [Acidimicrobiales bacterium]